MHPENHLIGYSDRWAVEPADEIAFAVSTSAVEYQADLVRLRHGDPRPNSPGLKELVVGEVGTFPGRAQKARSGSCVIAPGCPTSLVTEGFAVQLWVWPTRLRTGVKQGLINCFEGDAHTGWSLLLDDSGRLFMTVTGSQGTASLAGAGLREREWYFVYGSYDPAEGSVTLRQRPQRPYPDDTSDVVRVSKTDLGTVTWGVKGFLIAALRAEPDHGNRTWGTGHFDGKIENPRIFRRALLEEEIEGLWRGEASETIAGDLVATWDFAISPSTSEVIDAGPLGLHGLTVNMPTRAVTGHAWSGRSIDFNVAPSEYGAIHFHADDLEDAKWEPDFRVAIPEDLPSGVYAARLRAGDLTDRIPFVVRPPRGRATADIVLVLPTLTYLAYANEKLPHDGSYLEHLAGRVNPGPLDTWLEQHPELGPSLYDVHSDGSGCCYASRLRPVPLIRPDYLHWATGEPRNLGADLYLVDWLETKGFAVDVVTDEDVHWEGREMLDRYRVVLTGTHPEYVTERMLDALETWIWHSGGRLMYLGGNGFYWVTSIDDSRPHVIEVRRAFHNASWTSRPGEAYHSTTGAFGCLWRDRGRPPNRLTGVGTSAMGSESPAPGYRRCAASFQPETSWIFDGIEEEEIIGDFGLLMGGAAGHEVDRFDRLLASPAHAVVVGTSQGQHRIADSGADDAASGSGGGLTLVEEDRGAFGRIGEPERQRVGADIVYFETASEGAVFSVGSINWAGSLSHNGYDNSVSRVTENVLRRFLR